MKLSQAQLDALMSGVHPGHVPDAGQLGNEGSRPTVQKLVALGLVVERKRRVSYTISEYFLTEKGREIAKPLKEERDRRWKIDSAARRQVRALRP